MTPKTYDELLRRAFSATESPEQPEVKTNPAGYVWLGDLPIVVRHIHTIAWELSVSLGELRLAAKNIDPEDPEVAILGFKLLKCQEQYEHFENLRWKMFREIYDPFGLKYSSVAILPNWSASGIPFENLTNH